MSAIASAAGNVVEMILSIAALLKGLYSVVAASLIGSILSNLLLVLGGYRLVLAPSSLMPPVRRCHAQFMHHVAASCIKHMQSSLLLVLGEGLWQSDAGVSH